MTLSLSPRFDLFKFKLPKDFLADQVTEKYQIILNETPGVITKPIDYLNESIQGISFPGMTDLLVVQQQPGGSNPIRRVNSPGLGRINREPIHDINYQSTINPLENIDKEFRVSFRLNQGLFNYFMIYETIFYRACKQTRMPCDKVFTVDLLGETGEVVSHILYKDVYIDGIDGLDFTFSKIDREASTFDVKFRFNNIDFEFVENLIEDYDENA